MKEDVVLPFQADEQLRVGCACGWFVVGSEAEVVPAVLDHGQRIHNMGGTREQVLANAERLDAGGVPPDAPGRPR